MGWTMDKKYVAPHKCDTPYYFDAITANIKKGDIIRCDCGKRWECTASNTTSDQREGSSWTTLTYKEVPEVREFSGIYAPGTK
jgi:hypothetical protein